MSYKRWLFVAISLFCISLVVGLFTPDDVFGLYSEEATAFEELTDILSPLPQASIFVFIFFKNVSAVLISLVFSPVLCLLPLLALTINGWLIGFVSTIVIQEESLSYLLAGLLPHGILELPAFIMGEAFALSFGAAAIMVLFKKRDRNIIVQDLRHNLKYLIIAIGLLLPAAIIETYVTPLFLT